MAEESEGGTRAALRLAATTARPAVTGYAFVMRGVHAVGWRRIRFGCALVYFFYLADLLVRNGVPTGRKPLTYYVMIGLAITCLGRGWRRLIMVVVDWLPFMIVLLFYDQSRAIADTMGMPLHEADIAHAERWLFGGEVPTVWLQHYLYTPAQVHWYDLVATLTYTSHFVVTPVLAAVLWVRQRRVWLRYISRVILLSFAGLATYILFPEAPPWLAAKDGYLAPVARLSARGWQYLHAGFADRLLAAGQNGGANPVAAMPSLHLAFSFLAALTIFELVHWRWRWLLWLYPVTMAWTLMYTGEHYMIDLVFGALYALGCHWLLLWVEAWWHARRAARRPVVTPQPSEPATEVIGSS